MFSAHDDAIVEENAANGSVTVTRANTGHSFTFAKEMFDALFVWHKDKEDSPAESETGEEKKSDNGPLIPPS